MQKSSNRNDGQIENKYGYKHGGPTEAYTTVIKQTHTGHLLNGSQGASVAYNGPHIS